MRKNRKFHTRRGEDSTDNVHRILFCIFPVYKVAPHDYGLLDTYHRLDNFQDSQQTRKDLQSKNSQVVCDLSNCDKTDIAYDYAGWYENKG